MRSENEDTVKSASSMRMPCPAADVGPFFCTIGGSGSTYLIARLSEFYTVGRKPDAIFQPVLPLIDVVPGPFRERAGGFSPSDDSSIESCFREYAAFIQRTPGHVAVFNYAHEHRMFSRLKLRGVVFQVRHPLHSYASFSKPERHKATIDYYGGINSREAIDYYCLRWNSLVQEYLELLKLGLGPILVRFEQAGTDVHGLANLEWVYSGFDSTKRNPGWLDQSSEEYLRASVDLLFYQVYHSWSG